MQKTALNRGKWNTGKPHVRFGDGEVTSAKPRRGSLLGKFFGRDEALAVLDMLWGKKSAVVLVCGAVGVASSLFAQEVVKDRVLTISQPTQVTTTYTNVYNKVIVDADFTLNGAKLTNGYSGASITIGEGATGPVVVTVTNANGRAWETYSAASLYLKGKGGRIDLHGTAEPPFGWGTRYNSDTEIYDIMGVNYLNNGGTLGRHLNIYLNVDASVVPADKIVDVAHLYTKGFLGMGQFFNQTQGSIARILFDGGKIYFGHGASKTWFQPAAGTEIRLESVNGNPIYLWFRYPNSSSFTTADGTDATGVLSTDGEGPVVLGTGDKPSPLFNLKGRVSWGNEGGLYLAGRTHYRLQSDHFLPYGENLGDVYVQKSSAYGGDSSANEECWLDLAGTTQRVNSVCAYDGVSPKEKSMVTNTLAKRATLEVEGTIKGTFGGNIDILLKSAQGLQSDWTKCWFSDGVRGFFETGTFRPAEDVLPAPSVFSYDSSVTLIVSNNYFETFSAPVARTVVEGWRRYTYDWDKPLKSDHPELPDAEVRPHYAMTPVNQADAGKRDLAPSFLWTCLVTDGSELDVTRGVLVTSNLTAETGTKLAVSSNAAIRVQSRGSRSERFVRFTFKETVYKDYFALRRLWFVGPDGSKYRPGDKGYTRNAAATSDDQLAAGEYRFNKTFYTGSGTTLKAEDTDNKFDSYYESSDYTYDGTNFLGSSGYAYASVLFPEQKPLRTNDTSWITIAFRLKDDLPRFCGYGFSRDWNPRSLLNCWCVAVSNDGTTWTTVDERTDYYCFAHGSMFSNTFPYGEGWNDCNYNLISSEKNKVEGAIFRWTKAVDPTTVAVTFNAATVRVDLGGTLDLTQTDGTSTIAALEADPGKGMGTFRNVAFAADGTLHLVNCPSELRGRTNVPVAAFENCSGVANLASWKVTANGEPVHGAVVSYDVSGGTLTVCAQRGTVVGIR